MGPFAKTEGSCSTEHAAWRMAHNLRCGTRDPTLRLFGVRREELLRLPPPYLRGQHAKESAQSPFSHGLAIGCVLMVGRCMPGALFGHGRPNRHEALFPFHKNGQARSCDMTHGTSHPRRLLRHRVHG